MCLKIFRDIYGLDPNTFKYEDCAALGVIKVGQTASFPTFAPGNSILEKNDS